MYLDIYSVWLQLTLSHCLAEFVFYSHCKNIKKIMPNVWQFIQCAKFFYRLN